MVHVKSWIAALFLADSGIINAKVVEGFAIASIMLDMVMVVSYPFSHRQLSQDDISQEKNDTYHENKSIVSHQPGLDGTKF